MKHTLTSHVQRNKRGKDGKSRSYILWFVDDVQILKQKYPFDEDFDHGHQHGTHIYDVYILNGNIHQTRKYVPSGAWWRSWKHKEETKERKVYFPLSRKKLKELGVLPDVKIKED